jgi:hypothetical protein
MKIISLLLSLSVILSSCSSSLSSDDSYPSFMVGKKVILWGEPLEFKKNGDFIMKSPYYDDIVKEYTGTWYCLSNYENGNEYEFRGIVIKFNQRGFFTDGYSGEEGFGTFLNGTIVKPKSFFGKPSLRFEVDNNGYVTPDGNGGWKSAAKSWTRNLE